MFVCPVSGLPGNDVLHRHINLLLYFGLHKDYSTIHARPQTFTGSIEYSVLALLRIADICLHNLAQSDDNCGNM